MIFLPDENFPRVAVDALRQAGFDLLWIAELDPGAADEDVLALCVHTGRVLLTFDKDFGALAFRLKLPAHPGILLFRLLESPEEVAQIAVAALRSRDCWTSQFSVITRDRIRTRAIPSGRAVEKN